MDDNRFRAARQQGRAGRAHRRLVQRGDNTAGIIHPLRHLDAQITRDDRVKIPLHAIGLRPGAAAQLQHIAETGGGDQPGPAQLALQHGVCRGSGAVDD